jgi:hypothetical protein
MTEPTPEQAALEACRAFHEWCSYLSIKVIVQDRESERLYREFQRAWQQAMRLDAATPSRQKGEP